MRPGVGAVLVALLLASVNVPRPALAFESYRTVKQALYDQVFASTRKTLYCQCPYDRKRRPDLSACGYQSQDGEGERAKRIEVEHVVPASWLGEGRACWRKKICRDAKGRHFKGRKCCLKTDTTFRAAYQDLHNLWPTVGEVNQARRNYAFGLVDGERRAFGRCDVEVDRGKKMVEPRPEIRGDIARISLYMARTHHIRLSADQRHLFELWHQADPPDTDERHRNKIIEKLQGNANLYIGS